MTTVSNWIGVALAIGATAPAIAAMRAIEGRDYLATLLLVGLTWVIARTGIDLATARSAEGDQ